MNMQATMVGDLEPDALSNGLTSLRLPKTAVTVAVREEAAGACSLLVQDAARDIRLRIDLDDLDALLTMVQQARAVRAPARSA